MKRSAFFSITVEQARLAWGMTQLDRINTPQKADILRF
jgi:hypothetical protein